jgi:uncharacterized membrane protein HdeD (DUF308 family)
MTLDEAAEVFREAVRDTVKRHSLWYLLQGMLLIVGGILAIIYPLVSSVAVVVLLGWLLILSGIVQGISLIGARQVPHFWLQLVSVILGVLIVFFMIEGISKIVFALTIRPLRNWHWMLASGLVGILLSLILWASMPLTAGWLIGLLLGIELVSIGSATAYLAWQIRKGS